MSDGLLEDEKSVSNAFQSAWHQAGMKTKQACTFYILNFLTFSWIRTKVASHWPLRLRSNKALQGQVRSV